MLATKLKLREIEWTEKGIEKGRKEGREEGREEVREEVRKETLKLTARRLKSLGVPIDLIMKATGLSADEINALTD